MEEIAFAKENEPQILDKVREIGKNPYPRQEEKRFLNQALEYFQSQLPKSSPFLDPGVLINKYLSLSCETPKDRYGYGRGEISLISHDTHRQVSVETEITLEQAERLQKLLGEAIDLVRKGRNMAQVKQIKEKADQGRAGRY